MRVFAWIKLLVCVTLIGVIAFFASISVIRDIAVVLLLTGYFAFEGVLAIAYLRKYQKMRLDDATQILDSPDLNPSRMPLWYSILVIPFVILTILGTVNILLFYARQKVDMESVGYRESEIFRQTYLPAIFVLTLSLIIVSFNLLTAFRKIKPH
jgi:hypothetical protein